MRSKAYLSSVSTIRRRRWKTVQWGILLFMLAAGVQSLGLSQQNQTMPATPIPGPPPATALPPQAKPTPNPGFEQIAASPQDQRASADSAALLKLATELKTEVDRSTKDTLSLAVIRKAEEIERMAHGMKDKYRASAATN